MLSDAALTTAQTAVAVLEFRCLEQVCVAAASGEAEAAFDEEQMVHAEQLVAEASDRTRRECAVELQQALAAQEEDLRARLARGLEGFLQEKRRYFEGIEQQVVSLSLGIAEKVLQREAALDPLLLAGAVRVALESVSGRSAAILKVPAEAEEAWRRHLQGRFEDLTLIADHGLSASDCLLETQVGEANLGVRAQLAVIEQSLADLLGRRPVCGEV